MTPRKLDDEESREIKLVVSEKNEGTDSPYWLIIDPHQILRVDAVAIANTITGPFFSRSSAENHMASRRYAFGKNAVVYCMSGYWSKEYKSAWEKK